jgi:hypothetical protein
MNKLSLSKREIDAKDFLWFKVIPAMKHILKETFGEYYGRITDKRFNYSYYFAYYLKKKLTDYNVNIYQADVKYIEGPKTIVKNHRWIYIEHKENEFRKILLDYADGTDDWEGIYFSLVNENELPANTKEYKHVYRLTEPVLVNQKSESERIESNLGITCYQLLLMIDSHLKLT